jgi:hypothetical protein
MMPDKLTKTLAAFALWRKDKSSKSVATPNHLRQQTVALLSDYSKHAITTALHISGGQFKRWRLEFHQSPEATDFIQLSSPDDIPIVNPLSLEINLNGHRLLLTRELSIQKRLACEPRSGILFIKSSICLTIVVS